MSLHMNCLYICYFTAYMFAGVMQNSSLMRQGSGCSLASSCDSTSQGLSLSAMRKRQL